MLPNVIVSPYRYANKWYTHARDKRVRGVHRWAGTLNIQNKLKFMS